MDLSSLSSSDFKKLLRLNVQREKIAAQLLQAKAKVDTYEDVESQVPFERKGRGAPKRVRVPKLKNAIFDALTQAGDVGLTIQELSSKINYKPGSLYEWFRTTGKKVKGIKRVARKWGGKKCIYKVVSGTSFVEVVKKRRDPRKGRKRRQLKRAILNALNEAGSAGLSVKELSAKIKIEIKPAYLYTWFYTTGRKVKGLAKVGGKYILKG